MRFKFKERKEIEKMVERARETLNYLQRNPKLISACVAPVNYVCGV